MRDDFAKVLNERERRGSKERNKPARGRTKKAQKAWKNDGEGFMGFESSSRRKRYGYDCKQPNGSSSPFKKYLASRVGFPWNDTYSDICKHLSYKELDNVVWMVEENVVGFDNEGIPYNYEKYSVHSKFYVDGKGILRQTPKRKRAKPLTKAPTYLTIGSSTYGKRKDGLWYRLYFRYIPEPKYVWQEKQLFGHKPYWVKVNQVSPVYDVWLYEYYSCPERSRWLDSKGFVWGVYCWKFSSVNKKELKLIKKELLK